MKFIFWFGILINGFISSCLAEKISVAMEPFPPFVNAEGTGLTIDMLHAIEDISDLEFDIEIMTYARAKYQLKNQQIQILGHTPKDLETAEFYLYAQELNWKIDTTSDIFSLELKFFDLSKLKKGRIGTTLGNADFFSEQLEIPLNKFIQTSTLRQLVDMLIKRRIDVLVFERVSVMTLLQEKNMTDVYYQSIGKVPASIAVFRSQEGEKLKEKLDKLIKQLPLEDIFSGYLQFTDLPKSGKVPIVPPKILTSKEY
jgi:polar amino acid transport system substrate-binding protein